MVHKLLRSSPDQNPNSLPDTQANILHRPGKLLKVTTVRRTGLLFSFQRRAYFFYNGNELAILSAKFAESKRYTKPVDHSDIPFTKCNWEEQYPNAEETIPYDMLEPIGKPVKITVFCDASHADCLVTRRSTTGILIFVNGTPIR